MSSLAHRRIASRLGSQVPFGGPLEIPDGSRVAGVLDAVGEEGDECEQPQEDDAHVGRRGVAHDPVVPVL